MAGQALLAYRRGEDSEEALLGAMLEAEAFDHQRLLANFVVAYAKAMGGR